MSPASSATDMRMIVTPIRVSPLRMAQAMGAAPRYFGNSEAWTLMPPCGGTASTSRDRIWP